MKQVTRLSDGTNLVPYVRNSNIKHILIIAIPVQKISIDGVGAFPNNLTIAVEFTPFRRLTMAYLGSI